MSKWTLFSNHGHVLVVLSRDPDARLRDVAQIVGITERAVQKIVRDLQDGGLVSVTKQGRRNRYRLHPNQPLRHTLEAHCTTGELLEMVNRRAPGMAPAEPDELPAARPAVPQPEPVVAATTLPPEETPVTDGLAGTPGPAAPATIDQSGIRDETGTEPAKPRPARKPQTPPDDSDQGSLF